MQGVIQTITPKAASAAASATAARRRRRRRPLLLLLLLCTRLAGGTTDEFPVLNPVPPGGQIGATKLELYHMVIFNLRF